MNATTSNNVERIHLHRYGLVSRLVRCGVVRLLVGWAKSLKSSNASRPVPEPKRSDGMSEGGPRREGGGVHPRSAESQSAINLCHQCNLRPWRTDSPQLTLMCQGVDGGDGQSREPKHNRGCRKRTELETMGQPTLYGESHRLKGQLPCTHTTGKAAVPLRLELRGWTHRQRGTQQRRHDRDWRRDTQEAHCPVAVHPVGTACGQGAYLVLRRARGGGRCWR